MNPFNFIICNFRCILLMCILCVLSNSISGQVKISNNNSAPTETAIFQVESDDGVKFHINAADGRVGINTIDPETALDINGRLKIRALNSGSTMDSILTATSDGEVRMLSVDALLAALLALDTSKQHLSMEGYNLELEDGGAVDLSMFMDDTDDQSISLEGNTLMLENGGSVDLAPAMNTAPTVFAMGRHGANQLENTESISTYNSTISRVSEGIFDISFPDIGSDNYIIQLTPEYCGGDCPETESMSHEAPIVSYIGATISSTGFRVRAGDTYDGGLELADVGFMFTVLKLPGSSSNENENAAEPSGTATSDFNVSQLLDENSSSPWQLGFHGPNYAGSFNYEILLDNVPYTLHNLNLGDHTVIANDNGDGTYDYLFTSTSPISGYNQYRQITADPPAPTPSGSVGSGISCGCVSFYLIP